MQMELFSEIKYIGVEDTTLELFENQYPVPKGVSYNSYVILDQVVAVFDTVDQRGQEEWEKNLVQVLQGRQVDFLILQHLEPDHAGGIVRMLELFPQVVLVGNEKTFVMLSQYFVLPPQVNTLVVREGDKLSLGNHLLHFYMAPMVHWPEVMVTYDAKDKVLFSADGFGKFGALDADEDWACEARRYYFGIVGKYGGPTQTLLKKAAGLDIAAICPLHGPVLKDNLGYYLGLYNTWSSYEPEEEGVMIAFTSVYGNTKKAVEVLSQAIEKRGVKVVVNDLARCDMAEAVEDAFRYSKLVLATTTYNGGVFPFMNEFIHHLTERGYTKRTIAFVENGTWAPAATRSMKKMLENSKDIAYAQTEVRILSALDSNSRAQIEALAEELCR